MSSAPISATAGPLRTTMHLARRILIGGAIVLLGLLAFVTPIGAPGIAPLALGVLMIVSAALQALYALGLQDPATTRTARVASATSLVAGILLVAWGELVFSALAVLLGLSWVIDGVVKVYTALRREDVQERRILLIDGVINLVIGLSIAIRWPISGAWAVYLAVGIRLLASGWTILLGRVASDSDADANDADRHPDHLLGLAPHAEIGQVKTAVVQDELRRALIDRYWILTLLIVFFAIHIGRMDAQLNLVGLFSPFVAVVGDMFFALVLAYALIVPARLAWRFLARPLVKRCWNWKTATSDAQRSGGLRGRCVNWWLARRMRFDVRAARAKQSPVTAIQAGLRTGLPITAVLVAFAPLLGVSWYFNTETWATGIWDAWAAHRTDAWRDQMIRAVSREAKGASPDALFHVHPDIKGTEDFSFVVIGDTGEGDASQHVLRDQFLTLGARSDVKFLVLASDVIYPQGAMKDYETKFYLPFKGFGKPIYAIPGNHDWYDALEAFAANFFEPAAARAAMRARQLADHRLTTTTEARMEKMIREAGTLRQQYAVQSGAQRAPFFEIQTDRFALIAVDTGILKSIDPQQMAWLRAALERSRGKFKMIIPGHPRYAGGHDATDGDKDFTAFHQLLREAGADVVMAGDTHDFEFYRETYKSSGQDRTMLHFVNGGGGAYISIGTALDWPKKPPLPDCAFYPRTDAVIEKLGAEVPPWKTPLWWWVHRWGAWPSSAETLASAFASNRAPFFQSFVEIQVKLSAGVVRILPHTATGRLRWRELQLIGQVMPPGVAPDDFVEFSAPIPASGVPATAPSENG